MDGVHLNGLTYMGKKMLSNYLKNTQKLKELIYPLDKSDLTSTPSSSGFFTVQIKDFTNQCEGQDFFFPLKN